MESILQEQFDLSRLANISITESSQLPDFERMAYRVMLQKEMKKGSENFKI